MKRVLLSLLAMACVVGAAAQTKNDDVFIRIADDNMFSKCFVSCDKNGDNIVTYSEAAEATILSLSYGGRLNIIEDYNFLKHFPNLTALHVGNTTVESIDLSHNPKLEHVSLEQALWVRVVRFANGTSPQLFCPPDAKAMTILVGEDDKMPADLDKLNVEKYLIFSQPTIEEVK